MKPRPIRPRLLLALAFAVGVVFSFPNWWWYFTWPDYSIVRGYALSDDDIVPYAVGLNDASDGWPNPYAFLRTFETRDQVYLPSLSYWITNFMLGNLLRLTGSLELFVPVALLLSGIVVFLLFYALARQFLDSRLGAVLVSLFACFRYPFYLAWLAVAKRFVENGWQLDLMSLARLSYPGMVNAYQLYPYLRWPVPGMVYWWFLLSLYLIVRLAQLACDGPLSPSRKWLVVGTGTLTGLSAYVYFYFWTFLLGSLTVLAVTGWLVGQKGLARAMISAISISLLFPVPMLAIFVSTIVRPGAFQVMTGSVHLSFGSATPINFLLVLSTHGVIALSVALVALLTAQRPAAPRAPAAGLGRFSSPVFATLQSGLSPEAILLFGLHITVVLLASVELLGYYFWAWHWARHVMDGVAPLTVGWMIYRQLKWRPARDVEKPVTRKILVGAATWLAVCLGASIVGWQMGAVTLEASLRSGLGVGLLVPAIVVLTGKEGSRAIVIAAVMLTAGVWYFYHRTVNEMSWVAFLPLGLWTAARRPGWTRAAGIAFVGLNLLLALGLQGHIRPVMARPFFSQPKEYTEALSWLNTNTESDSVVATNGWLSDYLIRAYTHNLTLSAQSWWTPVSPAEQQERYLIRSAIYKVTPEFFDLMVSIHDESVKTFKANVNYYWTENNETDIMVENQATILYNAQQYAPLYSLPLEGLLGAYRVDYLWVGPWERYAGRRDFERAPEVTLVFKNSLVQIYRVLK